MLLNNDTTKLNPSYFTLKFTKPFVNGSSDPNDLKTRGLVFKYHNQSIHRLTVLTSSFDKTSN